MQQQLRRDQTEHSHFIRGGADAGMLGTENWLTREKEIQK